MAHAVPTRRSSDLKEILPIHPNEKNDFYNEFQINYINQTPFIYECRIKRHDGEYRFMRINATPRYNSSNDFIGFITHNIDIHERRDAELYIEQQRDYFYNLINAGEAFIYVYDLNGELTYVNNPMLDYLGVKFEDLIENKGLDNFFHSDSEKDPNQIFTIVNKNESTIYEQQLLNGRTGEYRWFRFVRSPSYNNLNTLTNWIVQAIDIDDVKKSEEAIRLSEQKVRASERYYRMLSNAGDTMVWVCDENNQCTYVNEPWIDFTGKN